ncbi:MAG TPA: NAD-dependent epimerase/dehydratase family protein [Gemmatimonadales bacterium]|nr:NAD-dependent epimerase/dehydratase family protein [Gemmatimonadales bacterium]
MIFLTGGTGLLGLAVLEALRSSDLRCTALVRSPEGARTVAAFGATPMIGTVEDAAVWRSVTTASAIVHCAALLRSREGWAGFERVNILGTRLAAARARELEVPMVHLSSVAVYGDVSRRPDGSVSEGHAWTELPPQNLYARSKREAEQAVGREVDGGLRAIVLRPCPLYGAGDRLFIPRLVASARRGWMPLVGRGDRPVPLVHARSAAQAVVAALAARGSRGEAYNVVGDGTITARGIVTAAEAGSGRPIRTFPVPTALAFALADGFDIAARRVPAGRMPGTARTGIGYWRGGDPFDGSAIQRALGWAPRADHPREIAHAVREQMAAGAR